MLRKNRPDETSQRVIIRFIFGFSIGCDEQFVDTRKMNGWYHRTCHSLFLSGSFFILSHSSADSEMGATFLDTIQNNVIKDDSAVANFQASETDLIAVNWIQ